MKLFLKRPDQSQGLVQKVLQASTTGSDNPDIRDRAYIYWRLLSSDPAATRSIVLAERPAITTTIPSLPPALLETLLAELSTLASVYHKPPAAFLGSGRFAADAMQAAAIEEQRQNARENPLAAAAAAAAVEGRALPEQTTAENLLDIDFDGAAPAALPKDAAESGNAVGGARDELSDLFGDGAAAPSAGQQAGEAAGGSNASQDLMNGFAGLDLGGPQEPPPAAEQLRASAARNGVHAAAGDDLLDLI